MLAATSDITHINRSKWVKQSTWTLWILRFCWHFIDFFPGLIFKLAFFEAWRRSKGLRGILRHKACPFDPTKTTVHCLGQFFGIHLASGQQQNHLAPLILLAKKRNEIINIEFPGFHGPMYAQLSIFHSEDEGFLPSDFWGTWECWRKTATWFWLQYSTKIGKIHDPFKNSHSCHGAFPKSLRLKVVFHALSIQINYPAFCPWLIGTKGLCKGRCKNASVPCWSQHKQHFTFKLFILHIKLGILAPFTRLFEVRKMASTGRLSCWDQNPSKWTEFPASW